MSFSLTSTAFKPGSAIPAKYTGKGDDVSPPLAWSHAPANTKAFALICEDPDAPSRANPRPEGPWTHWVAYNLPPTLTALPEKIERSARPSVLGNGVQTANDFASDNVGYRGPMPPAGSGPHRYFFRLYALDKALDDASMGKKALQKAMQGHVLGEAELEGTFEVPKK